MKIISHRGNLNGPEQNRENTLESIDYAIYLGFDVELDVFFINHTLYLGHDLNIILPPPKFLNYLLNNSNRLWIHCKNIEALVYLKDYTSLNTFGHSNDDFVLTSKKYIFCKPGLKSNNIIVMPELAPIYTEIELCRVEGILTDYPILAKEKDFKKFVS